MLAERLHRITRIAGLLKSLTSSSARSTKGSSRSKISKELAGAERCADRISAGAGQEGHGRFAVATIAPSGTVQGKSSIQMDAAIVDNPVKGRCYPRGITPHNFAELPSAWARGNRRKSTRNSPVGARNHPSLTCKVPLVVAFSLFIFCW